MRKQQKKQVTLAIAVPKGWGELTHQQVERAGEVLRASSDGFAAMVQLATEFAGLLPRGSGVNAQGDLVYQYYHRTTGNVSLSAEQISHIVKAVGWLTEGIAPMAAPHLDGYRVPDDRLMDLTLEQFITADVAHAAFASTGEPRALAMLAATIYAREPFDADKVQADAARIDRLAVKLYSVFLWFAGAKVHLTKKFPEVFSGEGAGEQPDGVSYMLGMLSSLNEGDVTKNEQLKALNLYEALHELNHKIAAANRKDA